MAAGTGTGDRGRESRLDELVRSRYKNKIKNQDPIVLYKTLLS